MFTTGQDKYSTDLYDRHYVLTAAQANRATNTTRSYVKPVKTAYVEKNGRFPDNVEAQTLRCSKQSKFDKSCEIFRERYECEMGTKTLEDYVEFIQYLFYYLQFYFLSLILKNVMN